MAVNGGQVKRRAAVLRARPMVTALAATRARTGDDDETTPTYSSTAAPDRHADWPARWR